MECRKFCESFRLDQVYLAEVVGPRRHYLGGYGRPSLNKAGQLWLSDKIMLFWHGLLPVEIQDVCKRHFRHLIDRLEGELCSIEESPHDDLTCQKGKEI